MPITSFLLLLKPGSASKARLCQHFKARLCQYSNKKTGKVFKINEEQKDALKNYRGEEQEDVQEEEEEEKEKP